MDYKKIFRGIWLRLLNSKSYSEPDLNAIEEWAKDKGLSNVSVQSVETGVFVRIPAIKLISSQGTALFPKCLPDEISGIDKKKNYLNMREEAWKKADWFEPPYITMIVTNPIIDSLTKVLSAPRERIEGDFDHHITGIYTMVDCATAIEQLFPNSPVLKEHTKTIREAYLSFYSGYKTAAIAALIPIVESAINDFLSAEDKSNLKLLEKVDHVIDAAVGKATLIHYEHCWIAKEFTKIEHLKLVDERVYLFETIRRWLKFSFFSKTSNYKGLSGLNRHVFAHGLSLVWQKPTNFHRLLGVLIALAWLEGWVSEDAKNSTLFPDRDDDSTLLFEEAQFRTEMQFVSQNIMAERYQKHGRIVPELPTDDGWLLRASILSKKCMSDLVRPLKDKGWHLTVSDPQKGGEYMLVEGVCKNQKISVALLYSCGTGNKTYKKLDENCQYILYLGAPYHQDQYAYGIKAHVGPLDAWQPVAPETMLG